MADPALAVNVITKQKPAPFLISIGIVFVASVVFLYFGVGTPGVNGIDSYVIFTVLFVCIVLGGMIVAVFVSYGYNGFKISSAMLAVILIGFSLSTVSAVTLRRKLDLITSLKFVICGMKNMSSDTAPSSRERVLILGASTVAGYGTRHCEKTIAAAFGEYFDADVEIIAGPGWDITDLFYSVFVSGTRSNTYKKIILMVGENDIISYSDMNYVEDDLVKLLVALRPKVADANDIILLHPGDGVWQKSIFPWMSQWYISNRSDYLQQLFEKRQPIENYTLVVLNLPSSMHTDQDIHIDGLHWNEIGVEKYNKLVAEKFTQMKIK